MQWARNESARGGRKFLELLEERLACQPGEFLARIALTVRMPALMLEEMREEEPAFDLIPYPEATRRGCVALRSVKGEISVVLGDPYDLDCQDWIEERLGVPFHYQVALRSDIATYLSQQETGLRALDSLAAGLREGEHAATGGEEISFETINDTDSTVVRLVNSTLYDAMKAGASDIHLESTSAGLAVKYRIDGVLTAAETVPGHEFAEQTISRIKVMSELDIAERRVPQDGRFKARRNGREIDFRVSIMPSLHGEDAVLRILDKQSLSDQLRGLTLDQLGFNPDFIKKVRRLATEPYGMLLATGPTGSGKTTTLYAAITEANKGMDKIITIEDPVEYQLRGITQIPINEKKGLTFARGLRSILRHDPDKIMVGEIRDPETAQIAIQSALTGHLVFTTVHANNVIDVLGRFLNMGVEPYQFVSALNCVLAQRLVRIICVHCKRPAKVTRAMLEESAMDVKLADTQAFFEGAGCIECGGTGFKGRMAICELLDLTDSIREMILERRPSSEIKKLAHEEGMRFLRESAVEKVLQGATTLREINKVTFVE